MRKIFKYAVGLDREIEVEMPSDSQMLRVEVQRGYQWLWASVDPESKLCIKKLICVGTGFRITEENIRYINTIFQDGYVWHYFEVLQGDELSMERQLEKGDIVGTVDIADESKIVDYKVGNDMREMRFTPTELMDFIEKQKIQARNYLNLHPNAMYCVIADVSGHTIAVIKR